MDNKWAEMLNPDLLRAKFVSLGLYMVAHEMLLSAIKDPLHEFYSDEWSPESGWKTSDDYRREVLALDQKGKGDVLRASLVWLRNNDVITQQDEDSVKQFTDARNTIAHEMRGVVSGDQMPDLEHLFPKIVELFGKIDRWWVTNVELQTDPDMAGKEFDESGVMPGSLLLMQMLVQVALGEDKRAWEFYQQFFRRRKS